MRILKPKEFLELPGPVLRCRLNADGIASEGLVIASDMNAENCTYYTQPVSEREPLKTAGSEKRPMGIDAEEYFDVDFSTPTREVVYFTAREAMDTPAFFAVYTGAEVRELIDTLVLALPSNQRRELGEQLLANS